MKIAVVTPLYRSSPYIEELYRRSVAAIKSTGASDYQIIFVNDASPDDSLEVARRLAEFDTAVLVIDLARNYGQHQATLAGLAYADGDYIFVIDSDLEEAPEWIASFLSELRQHGCDVVYGVNNNIKAGFAYSLMRGFFYRLLNYLANVTFPVNICTARLMSRRYASALLQFQERELYMAGLWHIAGFSQMPVEVVKEDTSPTSYSLGKLIHVFTNAVTSFSTKPLGIIFVFGTALSIVAFGFTAVVLYQKLIQGIIVEGWASVMAAVLLIGGMSLLFNGVMAIYIAKIFVEVKQRPRSIVKEIFSARGDDNSAHPRISDARR